jgi:Mitochondrial ribosomal protein subunit
MYRDSDSATTPYPIRQAIATTYSGLSRGDWGFKRPLPLRQTTRASNPALRITAIDTIEHITDYETATDHTKTLEKFQELGIAMVRRPGQDRQDPVQSAFELEHDNTVVSEESKRPSLLASRRIPPRWKQTGPIINMMTEGEFQIYLERKLKGQVREFADFLDNQLRILRLKGLAKRSGQVNEGTRERFYTWLAEMSQEDFEAYRRGKLAEDKLFSTLIAKEIPVSTQELGDAAPNVTEGGVVGEDLPAQQEPIELETQQQEKDIQVAEEARRQRVLNEAKKLDRDGLQRWDEGWEQYVRDSLRLLRNDTTVKSQLNEFIRQFLDMPKPPETTLLGTISQSEILTTHPSAGISYMRTNSVVENHPLLGPREQKTPFQARVLTARPQAYGPKRATLGVAGFAVDEPTTTSGGYRDADDSVRNIDLQAKGGRKIMVHVQDAHVDGQGRIRLNVKRAGTQAENVRNKVLPELERPLATPQASSRPEPLPVGEGTESPSSAQSSPSEHLRRLLATQKIIEQQHGKSKKSGESE